MSGFHPKLRTNSLGCLLLINTAWSTAPLFANDSNKDLVNYEIVANTIPQPLTKDPGDPSKGLAVFLDRARGHCLLCHSVESVAQSSQGNIGPPLTNVGNRLSKSALRLRIVDGTILNPDTAMPAYYRTKNLRQVGTAFQNKPVLSAQEIEDLVAWLSELRATNDR